VLCQECTSFVQLLQQFTYFVKNKGQTVNTMNTDDEIATIDDSSDDVENHTDNHTADKTGDHTEDEHTPECYICRSRSDNQHGMCNCIGDMSYAHVSCVYTWIDRSNKSVCPVCNRMYNISFFRRSYVFIKDLLQRALEFHNHIVQYNLYTGQRWDDMD
ncbi:Ubiquitin-conjugating enzyme E2 Z, partial [Yasminevirus sp. GU-2018]